MEGIAAFSTAPATVTEPALPADAVVAASISSNGLRAPRPPASPRPRLRCGRRPSGRTPRRDPERPLVGAALSARPWNSRSRDLARRTARGGRWRDGAGIRVPRSRRIVGADGSAVRGECAAGQRPHAVGVRTPSRRRVTRVCPGGVPHAGWPLECHGAARGRAAAPHSRPHQRADGGPRDGPGVAHILDSRRTGPAHRLRQRRQPAADARRRALPRARHPDGPRRKPRAAGSPAARRGHGSRAGRRRDRPGPLAPRPSGAGAARALGRPVPGGLAHGRARDECAACHVDRQRGLLRAGTGTAPLQCEARRWPCERGTCRHAHAAALVDRDVPRRRVRADAGAGLFGGARDALQSGRACGPARVRHQRDFHGVDHAFAADLCGRGRSQSPLRSPGVRAGHDDKRRGCQRGQRPSRGRRSPARRDDRRPDRKSRGRGRGDDRGGRR